MIASTSRLLIRHNPCTRAIVRSISTASPATTIPQNDNSNLPTSPLPAAYQRTDTSPAPTPREEFSLAPRRNSYGLKNEHAYRLHVFASRNNTILTLTTTPTAATTDPFHPVAWVSAGLAGYKGAARGTYDAGVEVSLKMFQKIADLVNPPILSGGQKVKVTNPRPTHVEIVWKGFGQGRDAVLRTLLSGDGDSVRGLISKVTDAVRFDSSLSPPSST
jgi:small subunit ribosomal protein S11